MKGKVALVTGGSSGLGRGAAEEFARHGASVVIAARGMDAGEAVAGAIRENGGEAMFVQADMACESDVQRLVARTLECHGRLDYAFNNAGGASESPSEKMHAYDSADFRRMIDVQLTGMFYCLKYELAEMVQANRGGAIVNMSSIFGLEISGRPTSRQSTGQSA